MDCTALGYLALLSDFISFSFPLVGGLQIFRSSFGPNVLIKLLLLQMLLVSILLPLDLGGMLSGGF
jgi:hypothetical protein